MNKQSTGGVAAIKIQEDILAYAAGYLEMVIGHHDSLEARLKQAALPGGVQRQAIAGGLRRQLHVQSAIVDSATAIVDELMLCERARGSDWGEGQIDRHRLQLLDEIRGLADQSVPQ